ncbi:hypothetical protein D3C84_991170 [compost metagenome]
MEENHVLFRVRRGVVDVLARGVFRQVAVGPVEVGFDGLGELFESASVRQVETPEQQATVPGLQRPVHRVQVAEQRLDHQWQGLPDAEGAGTDLLVGHLAHGGCTRLLELAQFRLLARAAGRGLVERRIGLGRRAGVAALKAP